MCNKIKQKRERHIGLTQLVTIGGMNPNNFCFAGKLLFHALYSLHLLPDVRIGKLSPFSVSNCNDLLGNVSLTR